MDNVMLAFLKLHAWDSVEHAPNMGHNSGFLVDGVFVSRLEGARRMRTYLNDMIEHEEREEMRDRLPAG